MNEPFLLQAARHYSGLLRDSRPGRYTFVFPNRRSSLFFKKYLGEVTEGAFFVPEITTISDMFHSLSGLEIADTPTQLFELWKVYRKFNITEEGEESLDDFLGWGSMILSDFNDVDQYLADARQLYTNIREQKEIQSDTSYLTEDQIDAIRQLVGMRAESDSKEFKKRFFGVWDSMYNVYSEFRQRLKEKGLAYTAMQYREVAEAIMERPAAAAGDHACIHEALESYKKVVFIGFSAPSNCEKVLMRFFKNRKSDDGTQSGEFLWDFYSSRIRDKNNRASSRISACVKEFPDAAVFDYDESDVAELNLIRASGSSEQTQILSSLLKEIADKEGWNPERDAIRSAVVVSDESMLFPILTSIPDGFRQGDSALVNITMPYPLKATPVASLESMLADLNINLRLVDGGPAILGKDLKNILDHPYVRNIDPVGCGKIISRIISRNLYFITAGTIREDLLSEKDGNSLSVSKELETFVTDMLIPAGAMVEAIEPGYDGDTLIKDIVGYQCALLSYIETYLPREDKGYVYKYIDALNSLANSSIPVRRVRTAYGIIRSITAQQSISFVGEPLSGLQIMGPLETRLLDFDNVIFLSFNEGYFPANSLKKSAIPYFLRKVFGLPTYEDNDSISSYNFYRLIQRARRLFFIYDSDNRDDTSSVKEPSRFIKQLRYLYGGRFNCMEFSKPAPVFREPPRRIEADELSRHFFDPAAMHRLSASSLKNYLACPAKFYFSRILNISAEEDLTESVDAKGFGSIFHYCMEHIYNDFRDDGKTKFTAGVLDGIIASLKKGSAPKSLEQYIDEAFAETVQVRRIDGENLIIKELVKDYIIKLLEVDRLRISGTRSSAAVHSFRVTGTEDKCSVVLHGKPFIGFFDRVDEESGVYVISDYKTGKVDIPKILSGAGSDFFEYNEREYLAAAEDARSRFRPVFPEFTLNEDNIQELLENHIIPFEESEGGPVGVRLSDKREPFYDIVFQILLYASMYRVRLMAQQDGGRLDKIDVAVYPLRHIAGKGRITAHLTGGAIDIFDSRLGQLLNFLEKDCTERGFLFNNATAGDAGIGSACAYCDFKKFCDK